MMLAKSKKSPDPWKYFNLETAVAEFAVAARREVFGYSNYAEDLRTKQMQ